MKKLFLLVLLMCSLFAIKPAHASDPVITQTIIYEGRVSDYYRFKYVGLSPYTGWSGWTPVSFRLHLAGANTVNTSDVIFGTSIWYSASGLFPYDYGLGTYTCKHWGWTIISPVLQSYNCIVTFEVKWFNTFTLETKYTSANYAQTMETTVRPLPSSTQSIAF